MYRIGRGILFVYNVYLLFLGTGYYVSNNELPPMSNFIVSPFQDFVEIRRVIYILRWKRVTTIHSLISDTYVRTYYSNLFGSLTNHYDSIYKKAFQLERSIQFSDSSSRSS